MHLAQLLHVLLWILGGKVPSRVIAWRGQPLSALQLLHCLQTAVSRTGTLLPYDAEVVELGLDAVVGASPCRYLELVR